MLRSRAAAHALLVVAVSLVGGVAFLEVALRLVGYRFTPLALVPIETTQDQRALHARAIDARLSATEPVTVFDSELFWRINPAVSPQLAHDGSRGGPVDKPSEPGDLLLALGDSNTLGPLVEPDHWPGHLQEAIDRNRNRSQTRPRVVNVGVYGYTAFQGLRLFRRHAARHPRVAYFSFGANDSHHVRTTDAEYAARLDRLETWAWSRAAPPLFHGAWSLTDRLRGHREPRPRVAPDEFRALLESILKEAWVAGTTPVLLTRPFRGSTRDPHYWLTHVRRYNDLTRAVAARFGAECVDVAHELDGADHLFVDESHLTRAGYQRMAVLLLRHLHRLGLVATDRAYAPEVALADLDDRRAELVTGWWAAERWSSGLAGRWTAPEARLRLERTADEPLLVLDLVLQHPANRVSARVEINGVVVLELHPPNRRIEAEVDISRVAGRDLEIRFVADASFSPHETDPATDDRRRLGIFVQSVALRNAHSGSKRTLSTSTPRAGHAEPSPVAGRET